MPRAKSEHYVDNKRLYAEMVEYLNGVKEAEESDSTPPRIPEYIGECLLKISTRLSTKPNFINYTYRDEMISDGIENCINYIGNFNPEKSTNPFAYFTQIIYYAFLRRIEKEKKQSYIKYKMLEQSDDIAVNKWFKSNYFEKDRKDMPDTMTKHFNLSESDIEKFTPKKKKKKGKK